MLLEIKGLTTQFIAKDRTALQAVDKVDLKVGKDDIHGLVGESGCGKSVTALSILRLLDAPGVVTAGSIIWKERNLTEISEKEMRKIRGREIAMVFQDPRDSLNPLYTIGSQMVSLLRLHRGLSGKNAVAEAVKLLKLVQIVDAEQRMNAYPHQLSGGMCQRVMIAMALSCRPNLLIADEPTAALDVTIQAQILDLLLELQEQFAMAILLISHDMGVIARMCNLVSVMYLGEIVESAPVRELYRQPRHPYTQALLSSVPVPDPEVKQRSRIFGDLPSLMLLTKGCKFRTRCRQALRKCAQETPELKKIKGSETMVACWLYE